MGQTLEALHRLQVVELQLAEVRRDREGRAQRVETHQRLIKKIDERLQQHRQVIRERQIKLDTLQLETASREDAVSRHRQALNKAKTNKEYAAILTAMNTEKADTAKQEAEVIKLMDEVQSLKDESAKIEAEKAKALEDLARVEKTLNDFDETSTSHRNDLQAQRDALAATIDPVILGTFNRVAEHHDGQAMAPIGKMHPKREEYLCSGCNMKVTLEVINALQTRDELQICRVCGRILFWESPEKQRARV